MDVPGASTRDGHPAPYPVEIAERLIRVFSFAGETVLDPFVGTGTTSMAALLSGRNSIGNEIEPVYLEMARRNVENLSREPRFSGAVRSSVCVTAS